MNGTSIFTRLQDADFYRDMHRTAVELLPRGQGKSWLDVGCGPGLLSRIAAARGYQVRGIDRSPVMIAEAKRLAQERRSNAEFAVSDLEYEAKSGRRYDVVSASSLLVVVSDPEAALSHLLALTKAKGQVLVIEAARNMSFRRALTMIARDHLGSHSYMLLAWATARSGRTLRESVFSEKKHTRTPLLGGLAEARLIKKD